MNGALWHHHAYRIISVATSSNFTSLGPISGLGPGLGREKSGLGRAKLKMPVYRAWAPIFACQAPGLVEIQIIIIIIIIIYNYYDYYYYYDYDYSSILKSIGLRWLPIMLKSESVTSPEQRAL